MSKRFQLRDETGAFITAHDDPQGLARNAAGIILTAITNDRPKTLEIWDCLRPNHVKVIASFTSV